MNWLKRKWPALLGVLLTTPLAAILAGALYYAHSEMRHETILYTQWLNQSIESFYFMLTLTLIAAGLCIAAWFALLCRPAKRDRARARRFAAAATAALAACACFAVLTAVREDEAIAAVAQNLEVQAPYFHHYGRSMVLTALTGMAGVASLIGFLRNRPRRT